MNSKSLKPNTKNAAKKVSVRINQDTKKFCASLLKIANDKKLGRAVKFEDLIAVALSLVTEEHLDLLQEASMTNEDRKEVLRQKYIETIGPITKDEFTGFMMSDAFSEFAMKVQPQKKAAIAAA